MTVAGSSVARHRRKVARLTFTHDNRLAMLSCSRAGRQARVESIKNSIQGAAGPLVEGSEVDVSNVVFQLRKILDDGMKKFIQTVREVLERFGIELEVPGLAELTA